MEIIHIIDLYHMYVNLHFIKLVNIIIFFMLLGYVMYLRLINFVLLLMTCMIIRYFFYCGELELLDYRIIGNCYYC